eukprot:145219-Pelagomonas_calceolata.AAC.9
MNTHALLSSPTAYTQHVMPPGAFSSKKGKTTPAKRPCASRKALPNYLNFSLCSLRALPAVWAA